MIQGSSDNLLNPYFCFNPVVAKPLFDQRRHGQQEQGWQIHTFDLSFLSLHIISQKNPDFLIMDYTGVWQNSWRKRFWSKGRKVKKKMRVCYRFAEEQLRRKAQDSSTRLWMSQLVSLSGSTLLDLSVFKYWKLS